MLSRKNHDQKGTVLPSNWQESTSQLLESAFQGKFSPDNNKFFVFGQTFSDEIFVGISFVYLKHDHLAPITYCISSELKENQDYSKLLEGMVDSAGVFFDTVFNTVDWNDYCQNWTSFKFKNNQFHYKVTRENIELTLKANELLGD